MFSTLYYELRNLQKHDTQGRKGHPETMSSQQSEAAVDHVCFINSHMPFNGPDRCWLTFWKTNVYGIDVPKFRNTTK